MLEWFQPTGRNSFMAGVLLSVIIVAFGTLRDWGFGWMGVWWLWLFVVPHPIYFFFIGKRDRMAAGADWFSHIGDWVKTYELESVRVTKAWGSDDLELQDAAGRKVSVSFTDIQRNLRLWDLVYNGVLHSVCSGRATTNQLARERLVLPWVPGNGEPSGVGASAKPRTMSKASRVVHTVFACVFVVAGILALAVAVIGATTEDAFASSDGIIGVVVLGVIGGGFIAAFAWLWRRLER